LAPADKNQASNIKIEPRCFSTLSWSTRQKGRIPMTSSRLHFASMSLAACALALTGAVACEDESTRPHNTPVEAGLQQVLDRAVVTPGVLLPGAIAHYRSPAYAPWSGSAGLADLPGQAPMRPDSLIRAGSILKTLVATVALQHVEEGTLSLDQTLPQLLPATVTGQVANADRISLRMLLDQTSGIPEWTTAAVHARVATDPGHVWTEEEALGLAAALPATHAPGTAWSYSNTNYTLIGMILDRLGSSWRQQVRSRVLSRVQMPSTLLPEPGDRTITSAHARGYQQVGDRTFDLSEVDPSMAGASGGNAMVTTAEDLARFLDALLEGRLFRRPETLATMTTMREAHSESGLPYRYGMGLESYELPGGIAAVGHAGGAAGYAVMMYRLPAQGATLVTAVNTSDMFANALKVLIPAAQVIAASPPAK
jgi:D-alanyl-D-alanine carboxypeptidase